MANELPPDISGNIEDIAQEIQKYLSKHPNAADTVEGILTWWLARQRVIEAKSDVQDALDYLEKNKIISKTVNYSGNIIYKFSS